MKIYLALMMVLITGSIVAQERPQKQIDLQRIIDDIIGTQDGIADVEALYENLALVLSNPLDINKASSEQLRFLSILTEKQLHELMTYRNENDKIISLYELQVIPEFDSATINRLLPFITIREPSESIDASLLKRILHEKNNYLLMRYERILETKDGFTQHDPTKKFTGSPDKTYLRFRTSRPHDFSVGFTLEKDAGEPYAWNPSTNTYGFDFISMHAQIQNKGRMNNLIVGDYQIQAGQGLVLGGAFGFGKGGEAVTTVRRSNIGGLPHTSTDENGNFRGALVDMRLTNHFDVTGFVSRAARDASIESDSAEAFITGIQTTGNHRNANEISKRKSIRESIIGGVVKFHHHQMDAGVIISNYSFDIPINRNATRYNGFSFNGSGITNTSLYLNYHWNNFSFFSETAKTWSGGYGMVAGVLSSLSSNLDIAIAYRNYQRDYLSFYSNAFSEGSTPQNESGIYYGWKYRWNKKIELGGYVDLFKFPWLRYRDYAPSTGYEWLLRLNYKPNKNTLLYFQYRQEKKDRNVDTEQVPTYTTLPGTKQNFLANYQLKVSDHLSLKTRVQFSSYSIDEKFSAGMAMIQDIKFSYRKFSATMRYALFDTDDYDNRQYVYEDDVLLAFSIPAYYGQGLRNYVLLSYDFNHHISCWFRYTHTRLQHETVIGSGVDAINGDQRSDIKFQMRIRL